MIVLPSMAKSLRMDVPYSTNTATIAYTVRNMNRLNNGDRAIFNILTLRSLGIVDAFFSRLKEKHLFSEIFLQ